MLAGRIAVTDGKAPPRYVILDTTRLLELRGSCSFDLRAQGAFMGDLNAKLKRVAGQIATTKKCITDQLALIDALRATGGSFAFAENTLKIMIVLLDLFQAEERNLQAAIEQIGGSLEQ